MYVTLYQNCKIQPNHYIENLETYLKGLTSQTKEINTTKEFISDKDSFSVRVEIDRYTTKKIDLGTINYCKLSTVDTSEKAIEREQFRYYFVTGFRNISQFVYEFDLSLDVVNTYQNDVTNVDNFKQVSIKRRHKNRFKESDGKYFRIYDEVDEGLGQVTSEVEINKNFSTSETYVITKQLTDSNDLHIPHPMIINQIAYPTASTASCSYYYANDINLDTTDNLTRAILIMADKSSTLINAYLDLYGKEGSNCVFNAALMARTTNEQVHLFLGFMQNGKFVPETDREIGSMYSYPLRAQNIKSTGSFKIYYSNNNTIAKSRTLGKEYSIGDLISNYTTVTSNLGSITASIPSINTINRTDSTIKQITSVPFRPDTMYYLTFNGVVIPEGVTTSIGHFVLADNYLTSLPTTTVTARDKKYESKLYGSYVRDHQIVYDTFSLACQPEYWGDYITSLYYTVYKPIDMTNDIAIKITNLGQRELNSNVLACNRNNSIPVWTSDWLTYVQNGYNYDNKAKSLTNIKNGLSVVASAAGTGFNIANKKDMGKGLGVFGIAQGITNTLSSLSNAITSGIENDRALKQKRQEMLNTAPTMNGSDNYLLFKELNGGYNCFKYVVTKPTDEVLDNIYNLFYYTGYADNMYYSTMPTIRTRQYFNYVQADISYCNIVNPKERQRLIDAYSNGITFEWNYNSTWLMNGNEYENWESNI